MSRTTKSTLPANEERIALLMTPDEVYAVAEVLGRVTVRQLRAMGLTPRERADVDRAHELLVELLQARLAADSRQLVLQLVNGPRPPGSTTQRKTGSEPYAR
jgi:hypothetical protein